MSNDAREQIDDEFAFAKTALERDDPAKAESILRALNVRVPPAS